ncbi:MAG: hypothetical protein AAF614_34155 [Chloroflexota bacterium]
MEWITGRCFARQKWVETAVSSQNVVLVFELWGHRNAHLIQYTTPLKLTLHTAIRHKKPLSYRLLVDLAQRYGFDLVPSLTIAQPDPDGLAQAYRQLQDEMEAKNVAAGTDVFVEEGAILMLSTAETAVYYKCKPPSIEEIHMTPEQGIGKEHIEHVLHKLLENGYDFDNGRLPQTIAAIQTDLENDFEPERVERAIELIERVTQDFQLELQKQAWLRQLVAQSGINPQETATLMRHLSQHYPKQQMRWVFTTVQQLYGRDNA